MRQLSFLATLILLAGCAAPQTTPTAVQGAGPFQAFIPTARVRVEPAVNLDAAAAPQGALARWGAHLIGLGAPKAVAFRRPVGANSLFLAVGAGELDSPGQDISLSLDGAIANDPAAGDGVLGEDEAPPVGSCALPAIEVGSEAPAKARRVLAASAAETEKFWVIRPGLVAPVGAAYNEVEVSARRVHSGKHCHIYLDQRVTDAAAASQAIELGAAFDETIYPADVRMFGPPPEPGIDGDSRVFILISPEVSASGKTSALAFFARRDLKPADATQPAYAHSNQREMLYVDASTLTAERWPDLLAAVAHEFSHLLQFSAKVKATAPARGEEVWLEEAIASYASAGCGYGINASRTMYQHVAAFLNRPYKYSLTDWRGNPGGVGYGNGYLFVHYMVDRFGEGLLRDLAGSPLTGKANLDGALKARGSSYLEAFSDWAAALANDGLFMDDEGRFQFKTLDLRGQTPFGKLNGPAAIRVGPAGIKIPRRADVAYLLHLRPGVGTGDLVLRSSGGPFGATALVP